MSIGEKDVKLLWGRAAGKCSHPDCSAKLTDIQAPYAAYLIGEMAHVIARNVGGPRSGDVGGRDTYDNLILLCPTHHRMIDKAPEGQFSEALLHSWKRQHEERIDQATEAKVYQDRRELLLDAYLLLEENRSIHTQYGPNSENAIKNPNSNAVDIWELRKLDTIVPNNKKVISMFDGNKGLLTLPIIECFAKFKSHATAFESNQYRRADHYPLFPAEFPEMIKREVS